MTPLQFQSFAALQLAERFGVTLSERKIKIGNIWKSFDYVSECNRFLGDAKFYGNNKAPSGKLATITEYVFLLEKCQAERKFIVFGNDKSIPTKWLKRYGSLLNGITFYFLGDGGLEQLN